MHHNMRLNPSPFSKIKTGKKKVEYRLYDKKRQQVKVHDTIKFTNTEDLSEKVSCKVLGLMNYPSFIELARDLQPTLLGSGQYHDPILFASSMESYYSLEKQKEFGVLGIRLEQITSKQNY